MKDTVYFTSTWDMALIFTIPDSLILVMVSIGIHFALCRIVYFDSLTYCGFI